MLHSMGGAIGSGVGSLTCGLLEDNFPEVFRFSTVVYPEDDVVTGPYNSLLAQYQLSEHSDCILPIHNKALFDILSQVEQAKGKISHDITGEANSKRSAFDKMNNIIAHMLNNLTCSMRFEGSLNVDLNEITMNLVPFPKMQSWFPVSVHCIPCLM